MTSAVTDIRDVLGLDLSEARPPPVKRQKTIEKRPDGITRELYALLGDNAPPVSVVDTRFKEKPKWFGKPSPWIWKEFENEGREDSLKLGHWVRKTENVEDESVAYQFSKFNIRVSMPEYDAGEYELGLTDSDWSKEETDYLFSLLKEYDLRWIHVADRYHFEGKDRTMEDMKARYYAVSRTLMEMRTPVSVMTPEQMTIYNSLHFDKEQETERKRIALLQMERTPQEIEMEQHLIAELKRINDSYASLLEEREELFQRLDFPQSSGSIQAYTGSQGLAALASTLQASDKNKKRKSIAATPATPAGDGPPQASPAVARRESMSIPEAKGHHRTDSIASTTATLKEKKRETAAASTSKTLNKAEEAEYMITHHDKLTPGVFARSQRLNIPKGTSWTVKIQNVLTELGVNTIGMVMPTARVVAKYEQLCQEIGTLIDAKKLVDKIDHEIRVFKQQETMGETNGGTKRSASVMSDTPKSTKKPKKDK